MERVYPNKRGGSFNETETAVHLFVPVISRAAHPLRLFKQPVRDTFIRGVICARFLLAARAGRHRIHCGLVRGQDRVPNAAH